MHYDEALAFVNSFSRSGAPVTDLSRIAGLLERLGNPQKALRFVHIAGTNGKGSCAAYLTNILVQSGYRTGTLTSPYIRHYRDRICLNGADIPKEALCTLCETVQAASGDAPYSQFEITMAIAMLYFQREQAHIVVLETGIGGLLDATNVIDAPLVCVITSVSMDHTNILGGTLEEITRQKAGIIKPGCAVSVSPQNKKQVFDILWQTAKEKGAVLSVPSMDVCVIQECGIAGNRFLYKSEAYSTKMGGNHQISNALTVIQTVEFLRKRGFSIPEEAVQKGLAETQVAGRIQVLQNEPLVILDGGHNADGVGALTDLLSESGIESWIGICGMTDQKDADAAAFQLALVLRKVLCVDGFSNNALPAEKLKEAFVRQHVMATPMILEEALSYALKWAKGSHGAVVICGSLYLASWYLHQED